MGTLIYSDTLKPLDADGKLLVEKLTQSDVFFTVLKDFASQYGSLEELFRANNKEDEVFIIAFKQSVPNKIEVILCLRAVPLLAVPLLAEVGLPSGWLLNDISRQLGNNYFISLSYGYMAAGMLTGMIAHDFNNYLGAADGALSLLTKNMASDEKLSRRSQLIVTSLKRAADLSQTLGLLIPHDLRRLLKVNFSEISYKLSDILAGQFIDGLTPEAKELDSPSVDASSFDFKVKGNLTMTTGLISAAVYWLAYKQPGKYQCLYSVANTNEDELVDFSGKSLAGKYFRIRIISVGSTDAITAKVGMIGAALASYLFNIIQLSPLPPLSETSIMALASAHDGHIKFGDKDCSQVEIALPVYSN